MTASGIGLVLLVACVVAMLSRRLRLPYSVGLVVAGIGLAVLGGPIDFTLASDLIFPVLLPPLIFEAALQIKWRRFRDDLPVSLTLAFPGVLLAGAIIAAGMHLVIGWSWLGSALFGALIAATDPVSVIAAFKEMKVEPRLSLLVESESLLNDGAAAVAFAILASVANGATLEPMNMAGSLLWMVAGGVVAGGLVAGALLLLAGRTEDHLVEITLTTIAAYGSFLLAEHFHMSGVLATLSAGLIVGNVGWKGSISEAGREHVVAFWEYAAFLANSVVFILIGGHEANHAAQLLSVAAAVAVPLVLVSRWAAVYPLCALFARSTRRVDPRHQHVLFWGGLRGALALALALAIPASVPEKNAILIAAFSVVAFSIFIQGLSMPWLIRTLRLKAR
ncbi:cation:proton antiporter [Telmatospirillum siberiense]|uniref:Sodium:proton exchanger n=1 Tax=Telmatospirillum siberiense TaxID=382514 RepID=A0A2N3PT83_9PROT|nr:sodium:proton antiporter [Telmatospirillum siberiense]PKU23614.1 sodium:proton exchanger [Telmatospirillum siberiense]